MCCAAGPPHSHVLVALEFSNSTQRSATLAQQDELRADIHNTSPQAILLLAPRTGAHPHPPPQPLLPDYSSASCQLTSG